MKTLENIQNILLNTNMPITSIELKNERKVFFDHNFLTISKSYCGDTERTMYYDDSKKFWAAVKRYIKQQ